LEEAEDPAFTLGLRSFGELASQQHMISSRPPGTYYYRVMGKNVWGESGWSNVQSITVTYADLIINGGFESGPPAIPWIQSSSAGLEIIHKLGARTGNWGVYMGGLTSVHDYIYQAVSIPDSVNSLQLEYWRLIRTSDSITTVFDEMRCVVWDTSGDVLAFCGQFSNVDQSLNWVYETFDMSPFKGESVHVGFMAHNDEDYSTQFFIDDVSLTISSSTNAEKDSASTKPNMKWLWSKHEDMTSTDRYRERLETRTSFRTNGSSTKSRVALWGSSGDCGYLLDEE
jgi:hypothetical protein